MSNLESELTMSRCQADKRRGSFPAQGMLYLSRAQLTPVHGQVAEPPGEEGEQGRDGREEQVEGCELYKGYFS